MLDCWGTMRNVFVGAGCKKYKSPDSHWCKGGPVRVGELVEESRVVAEQAEDRDDQAEEEGRRRAAACYANRTSVIHEGTRFTWAQTYERCRRLAFSLRALNIARNDVVSVTCNFFYNYIMVLIIQQISESV
ncbi:hypothetical protein JHK85_049983 [Glycine max]|nr:hypothetical protein JHK85_049983 [Glycine max]